MALAMPVVNNTFDPFCWLQSQMFTDSSSQDKQEMDFCDDNNNHIGDYTTPPYQNDSTTHNPRQYYGSENICTNNTFNMQNNQLKAYQNINLVDSPPNSKEPWPAEYVKTIIYETSPENTRKRKGDWQASPIEFGGQNMPENGPGLSKISITSKGSRKSLGRLGWPDDIADLDLSSELMNNGYSNDSLLNFPNLTTEFKQEVPSPTNQEALKIVHSPQDLRNAEESLPTTNNMISGNPDGRNGSGSNSNNSSNASGNNSRLNINHLQSFLQQNGFDGGQGGGNGGNGNDSSSNLLNKAMNDDCRFQYVLGAATSIATKCNEESLTYLNQGQSYEIKLKKLGDLSAYRGKVLKSVVKICFHERRLQYMEREQMTIWQASRPGERILDIDIPLSYGLVHNNPSSLLNTAEIMWDPMKDVGVYIKVNCISTEFTPKKHGGEKGVPFRIQIETFFDNGSMTISDTARPLHAACCQIKVFKLKGADRKHKQDRERIHKRPSCEQDKYQRSYDCTILNDIPSELLVSSSPIGSYSPEHIKRNSSPTLQASPVHVPSKCFEMPNPNMNVFCGQSSIAIGNVSSTNGLCKIDQSAVASTHYESDELVPQITKDSTPNSLSQWLSYHRLTSYANTFSHFSGSDLLRMSKEDLTQICGLADGIRMFNILHAKALTPRLTIYVSLEPNIYHAIFLHSITTKELVQKLYKIPTLFDRMPVDNNNPFSTWQNKFAASSPNSLNGHAGGSNPNLNDDSNLKVFVNGPNGVLIVVTDEVLGNIKDQSLFALEVSSTGNVLMKSIFKNGHNEA